MHTYLLTEAIRELPLKLLKFCPYGTSVANFRFGNSFYLVGQTTTEGSPEPITLTSHYVRTRIST
jgi:hypothetical protein